MTSSNTKSRKNASRYSNQTTSEDGNEVNQRNAGAIKKGNATKSLESQVKPLELIGSSNSSSVGKAQRVVHVHSKRRSRNPRIPHNSPSTKAKRIAASKIAPTNTTSRKRSDEKKRVIKASHSNSVSNSKKFNRKGVNINPYSERSVFTGDGGDLDCIEVTMKRRGMELTLVSSPKEDEQGDDNNNSDNTKHNEKVAVSKRGNEENTEFNHPTKVYYTQMSTRYHPHCAFDSSSRNLHRIPTSTNQLISSTFNEKLSLLKSYLVKEEEQIAKIEYKNLWMEMKAIEENRDCLKGQQDLERKGQRGISKAGKDKSKTCPIPMCNKSYDINYYLNTAQNPLVSKKKSGSTISPQKLDKETRRHLQQSRGAFVHVGLRFNDALQKFSVKCGGNPNSCQPHWSVSRHSASLEKVFGMSMISSPAATVRHLAIIPGMGGEELQTQDKYQARGYQASFFLSKDDGRCYYESLDASLEERLKKFNHRSSTNVSIRYLSCGPNRSYFAELVSGHIFWGMEGHDEEFKNIMDNWGVHRVAFGSFEHDTSWLVLGKDGKVAWRNIPCRLHKLLLNRRKNQVCSLLSLGCGTFEFM